MKDGNDVIWFQADDLILSELIDIQEYISKVTAILNLFDFIHERVEGFSSLLCEFRGHTEA